MKKIHIEFSDERLITSSGLVFVRANTLEAKIAFRFEDYNSFIFRSPPKKVFRHDSVPKCNSQFCAILNFPHLCSI